MATLRDFSPLESITLPSLGTIDSSGLTLIVGPNSSGKSQFLRDIALRLSGEPRQLVVATDVKLRYLAYTDLLPVLKERGFLTEFEDDAGTKHLRPLTTYAGSGQQAQQIPVAQLQTWYNTSQSTQNTFKRRDEYLGYLGRFLVTALFLDTRLTALNQAGMIDFISQSPQHDLQALYMNDQAREELFEEIRASFGKAVWPDVSRGTGVCLRVSDEGYIPTSEERLSPRRMAEYRTIETEGDGLKSYVATCVALLLGRRPVCIVDEPELCLHPPQAYNLGRFIGRFGSSLDGETFVATHSSHILRGVIETAPRLRIIRMTRLERQFQAHTVSAEVLQEALQKPTVRAESVLDGIFAQAIAVVEADGDRTVYQAVWETLERDVRMDLHFTTVGGTGGIADTCRLYRTLKIPIAVIADLDVVADPDRIHKMLEGLGAENAEILAGEARRISEMIRSLPPTISESETRAAVLDVVPDTLRWENGDDSKVRTALRSISNKVDRMRRLKVPGEEPLPPALANALRELLAHLKAGGLFVVPVGELEGWLHGRGVTASKHNKWAWANDAASVIRAAGRQEDDVWAFVTEMGLFLDSKLTDTVRS